MTFLLGFVVVFNSTYVIALLHTLIGKAKILHMVMPLSIKKENKRKLKIFVMNMNIKIRKK